MIAPERLQEPGKADDRPPTQPVIPVSSAASIPVLRIALAGFLSTAAAGWMLTGVFNSFAARAIGIGACAVGAGIVAASFLTRRPTLVQYLVLPVAMVLGALLVLPDARGGSANLAHLVVEAIRSGGLAQPPIAFDPGWRFLVMVFFAMLSAGAAALAIALNRPKLAVALPIPVIMAAALVQPARGEILTSAVAIGSLLAALAVSFGTELAVDGQASGSFEVRRLGRGAAMIGGLALVTVLVSKAGFLFPQTTHERVVPPQPPRSAPAQADRLLFTVTAPRPGPWRVGVLDVYQKDTWLLPPYDTARYLELQDAKPIIYASKIDVANGKERSNFVLADAEGHSLPGVYDPLDLRFSGSRVQFDPRTQSLRLPDRRAFSGFSYSIESPVPPGGLDLSQAPAPSGSMKPFLEAPAPPNEIVTLLAGAPVNLWDRLQYVRARFYEKVVASGPGNPRPVPPRRVVELLKGREGSPFEITASEALLARWAGVPSRIGYGFYEGEQKGNTYQVRPKNGANWLEAYFEGYGWIPIVGTPPHAKASLSEQQKQTNPEIQPTEDLGLVVYVPIKLQSVKLIYVFARYWIAVGLLVLFSLMLILWSVPGFIKIVRSVLRDRWAAHNGMQAQILAAYAAMRDTASDLNVGDPVSTPIRFLRYVEKDEEHEELAWLVTRGLWGDLQRDLTPHDVRAAQEMSASVIQRLRRGQGPGPRLLAFGSRDSLRAPHSEDLPNPWPSFAQRGWIRSNFRRLLSRLGLGRKLKAILRISMLMLLTVLSACSAKPVSKIAVVRELPARIAPATIGDIEFRREADAEKAYRRAGNASLVNKGVVYTIRRGSIVEGSLQIAPFKKDVDLEDPQVLDGVLASLGTGRFDLKRVGDERIYVQQLPEQQLLVWFPPDLAYMQLMVARKSFAPASDLFANVLRFRRGETASSTGATVPFDPRRGGDA